MQTARERASGIRCAPHQLFFQEPPGQNRSAGALITVDQGPDNPNGPVGPELLGRLIDRHAAALELYASQLCACPEDVVQDALVQLARRREAPDQPLGWLYRAVRHGAINAERSRKRRKRHEAEAAFRRPDAIVALGPDSPDTQSVAAALESLSGEQREVVVAHVWGGLTFQQIGHLIGTSDSTAHRRYQAALAAIRKTLRIPCPKTT